MKINTRQKIKQYISQKKQVKPSELGIELGISQVAVHKQLKKLLQEKELVKVGKPPLVFYAINLDKKQLELMLNLPFPHIDLVKAYAGEVRIAQKSLSKIEERLENARKTIFVNHRVVNYQSVLIIDDEVDSGATLNETAKKLKEDSGVKEVYGFAVVGSLKGFPVIKEV